MNDAEYEDIGVNTVKVFYHERPATEAQDMLEDIPRTTFFEDKNYDFPFTGMYKITKGKLEKVCMQWSSEKFNDVLNPIIEKNFKVQVKSLWDLPKEAYDKLLKKISETSWGTRIGGQPNFTQWDPRIGNCEKYENLLFQLDSEKGIMWGDVGIANWFISEANLKSNKFNDILFNWDCY